jgi:hypothetical protein
MLEKFYMEMNKKGKKFEVVFVSRDRSHEEFAGYFSKMPWLAVPLENVNAILQVLAPKFDMKGIPHLVILDGDDASLITTDGRTNVLKDSYGLTFPVNATDRKNMCFPKMKSHVNMFIFITVAIAFTYEPSPKAFTAKSFCGRVSSKMRYTRHRKRGSARTCAKQSNSIQTNYYMITLFTYCYIYWVLYLT